MYIKSACIIKRMSTEHNFLSRKKTKTWQKTKACHVQAAVKGQGFAFVFHELSHSPSYIAKLCLLYEEDCEISHEL